MKTTYLVTLLSLSIFSLMQLSVAHAQQKAKTVSQSVQKSPAQNLVKKLAPIRSKEELPLLPSNFKLGDSTTITITGQVRAETVHKSR